MSREDIPKLRYKINFIRDPLTNERKWKCNKCSEFFTAYRDLKQHKKSVHCY